ncbi:hypothetical protein IWW36_003083, partial [Coemansia brasiliensis]
VDATQSSMISVSLSAKISILLQYAIHIAEIYVQLIEGPSIGSLPFAKLTSLLVLLSIVAAGTWGMVSVVGAVVAASGISQLLVDVFCLNALLAATS